MRAQQPSCRAHATWHRGESAAYPFMPRRTSTELAALGIYSIWLDAFGEGLPADCAIKPDRIICALRELLDGEK